MRLVDSIQRWVLGCVGGGPTREAVLAFVELAWPLVVSGVRACVCVCASCAVLRSARALEGLVSCVACAGG